MFAYYKIYIREAETIIRHLIAQRFSCPRIDVAKPKLIRRGKLPENALEVNVLSVPAKPKTKVTRMIQL
jgi:hypothetical protein